MPDWVSDGLASAWRSAQVTLASAEEVKVEPPVTTHSRPRGADGVDVGSRMVGHAQEERHVAGALAVGGVGRQGVRHLGRRRGGLLRGGATRGAVSGRHLDVDARQVAGEKPVLPGGVVVEVHEAAHGAARGLAVVGAAGAHALHEGKHVAVAAVVGVEPDAVGLPHRPALGGGRRRRRRRGSGRWTAGRRRRCRGGAPPRRPEGR